MTGASIMNLSSKELATPVAAFVITMIVVYALGPREFMTGDTTHYMAMVRGETAPSPFAYRLLTPALVAAFPGPPAFGFFLIAYIATLGTLLVMFKIFKNLGISTSAATVTGVLLCLSYPLANYLSRWGRIDPLANFFFALALWWILERRFLPASLAIVVGVLGKETLLFLLPILFVHRARDGQFGPRALIAATAICLLPIVSFLSVRQSVEVTTGSFTVQEVGDLDQVWSQVWSYNVDQFGLSKRIARDLTKSYGFFWALAGLGLLIDRRLRLESLYLVAIGFALCAVATDWARMLGTGFPGIFIPVALFVDRLRQSLWWRPLTAGFLVLGTAQCYLSLLVYRDLDRSGQLAMVAAGAAVTLAGTALAVWAFFSHPRQTATT